MQLAATIVITAMNNVLVKYGAVSKYGSEIPMTTLGITMKVNQIITGIVIGIAVGSQPIIGYNYGAGKAGRAKKGLLFRHHLLDRRHGNGNGPVPAVPPFNYQHLWFGVCAVQ